MSEFSASRPVRVAFIGVGAVTAYHHLPGLRMDPRAELAAICDADPALLARRQAEWGVDHATTDALAHCADDRIDATELSEEGGRGGAAATRDAGLGLKARVDALEAQLVRDALVKTQGNQTRAAEVLGISRFGLQKMMRRLGIRPSG